GSEEHGETPKYQSQSTSRRPIALPRKRTGLTAATHETTAKEAQSRALPWHARCSNGIQSSKSAHGVLLSMGPLSPNGLGQKKRDPGGQSVKKKYRSQSALFFFNHPATTADVSFPQDLNFPATGCSSAHHKSLHPPA